MLVLMRHKHWMTSALCLPHSTVARYIKPISMSLSSIDDSGGYGNLNFSASVSKRKLYTDVIIEVILVIKCLTMGRPYPHQQVGAAKKLSAPLVGADKKLSAPTLFYAYMGYTAWVSKAWRTKSRPEEPPRRSLRPCTSSFVFLVPPPKNVIHTYVCLIVETAAQGQGLRYFGQLASKKACRLLNCFSIHTSWEVYSKLWKPGHLNNQWSPCGSWNFNNFMHLLWRLMNRPNIFRLGQLFKY